MSQGGYYGGGGGYVQGGSPYSAGGSPGGGNRRTDASQSIRPFTIAQLGKATQAHTDAEWMLDEMVIGHVTTVGQVIRIQKQATNSVYNLHDGTGHIEVRHWNETTNEEDDAKWGGIQENQNVRVVGSLKTFGSKRYLNATQIRVSEDPHETFFHILECVTCTLIADRGPPVIGQQQVKSDGPSVAGSSTLAYQSHSAQPVSNDEYAHLPKLQRDIVHFMLKQESNEEGVHVASIARSIGGGDAQMISDALDRLMDDGVVFSTIDDSHFSVSR
ncbi:replication protein A, subunit RPA32 [Guyanagaster necrorhizus]|uniref:Replication protein A, subunit RPA32 n=1 Tax=Guyanagaster necrorhizus TaxID=856835 RepID=A0A9P7W2Z1_9AGAR|nr:replication protein A, subunit RPA32 [Guyanagaster necrorhizus MCA 3950]KAG7452416.1 replication protein A, subunit RPA32 [Guyanagaster necrorhizus MCA 3950]